MWGGGSRPRYVFLHTFFFFLTLYPSLSFINIWFLHQSVSSDLKLIFPYLSWAQWRSARPKINTLLRKIVQCKYCSTVYLFLPPVEIKSNNTKSESYDCNNNTDDKNLIGSFACQCVSFCRRNYCSTCGGCGSSSSCSSSSSSLL